jgi:MFS family permease
VSSYGSSFGPTRPSLVSYISNSLLACVLVSETLFVHMRNAEMEKPMIPQFALPLKPCWNFFWQTFGPGMGLFGESYLLFSIGTLQPFWNILYPECFTSSSDDEADGASACRPRLRQSLTYSIVLGVISGMLVIGCAANVIGRRKGSILTASLMSGASIALTLLSYTALSSPNLFRCMSCVLFVFGVGVGGEYPLSASSASEKAMVSSSSQRRLLTPRQQERGRSESTMDGLYTVMEDDNDIRHHTHAEEIDSIKSPLPTSSPNRGRQVQLVFTMQGVGIFCNSLIITILIIVFGQTGDAIRDTNNYDNDAGISFSYNHNALLSIWRWTYTLGAVVLTCVWLSRIRYLPESTVWKQDKDHLEELARDALRQHHQQQMVSAITGYSKSSPAAQSQLYTTLSPSKSEISVATSVSSLSVPSLLANDSLPIRDAPSIHTEGNLRATSTALFLRNYGVRLLGTSLSWMLWDIAFYGNKLFQSSFLIALTGSDTTLLEFALAATLNAAVALLGYFGAAILLDVVGRRKLQQFGFLLTGTLFVACGFLYEQLSSTMLIALYLGSSFFGQLGPNATTFLVPAEIFPTSQRTMCHGIAAASGKCGALLAAVLFHNVGDVNVFRLSGYASSVACVVTF